MSATIALQIQSMDVFSRKVVIFFTHLLDQRGIKYGRPPSVPLPLTNRGDASRSASSAAIRTFTVQKSERMVFNTLVNQTGQKRRHFVRQLGHVTESKQLRRNTTSDSSS